MAGHDLIDGYLASMARRLPTDTVDEGYSAAASARSGTGLRILDSFRSRLSQFDVPVCPRDMRS
ncbi:MAG TPA: hypothetical protein VFR67_26940 [Pilimelia sp.]|nr:hypothetical protein [Pilimelia sp.]